MIWKCLEVEARHAAIFSCMCSVVADLMILENITSVNAFFAGKCATDWTITGLSFATVSGKQNQ